MEGLQYLDTLRKSHPNYGDDIDYLEYLYIVKQWDHLTFMVDQFLDFSIEMNRAEHWKFYLNFITHFETKINPLKLGHLAVRVSRLFISEAERICYLKWMIKKMQSTNEMRMIKEPIILINMEIAILLYNIGPNNDKECKKLLEDGKTTLDSMTDIDPSVYASYYWSSSQHHKSHHEYAEFYKRALLFLGYTSTQSFSYEFELGLAIDLSISALLGEGIYNFQELLSHPIIRVLKNNRIHRRLYFILLSFGSGNLALCKKCRTCLMNQPALVENEKKLTEKLKILCLVNIISRRPPEDRIIPLHILAKRTEVSIKGVECLLMKSFSVHLMEGIIDQVEGSVLVTWVQPKVLKIPQITPLLMKTNQWLDKVDRGVEWFELEETPDAVSCAPRF